MAFTDFVQFAGSFGIGEGDEAFDARFDLNGDGGIAFNDFVIFAKRFGEAVNRGPVFALASQVRRSVAEECAFRRSDRGIPSWHPTRMVIGLHAACGR